MPLAFRGICYAAHYASSQPRLPGRAVRAPIQAVFTRPKWRPRSVSVSAEGRPLADRAARPTAGEAGAVRKKPKNPPDKPAGFARPNTESTRRERRDMHRRVVSYNRSHAPAYKILAQSHWRRRILAASGLVICIALWCASPVCTQPLNVIVVMVDDLGWRDLGCQGSTFYQTPHIDRLAADGMRFTNGYAACAVCSPTRAAYMTGRYPARLGITDWIRGRWQRAGHTVTESDRPPLFQTKSRQKLLCPRNPYWMELDERTLAENLQDAGYVTGHVGKWHLGGPAWYPQFQGYSENVGGCDLGHPPSYFDPYAHDNPDGPRWQIDNLSPRRAGEYLTDREADEAVAFIHRHADEPFFLSLCHYAVHTPIEAKPALTESYQQRTDPQKRQTNARYAAMIQSVDESLGAVRQRWPSCNLPTGP